MKKLLTVLVVVSLCFAVSASFLDKALTFSKNVLDEIEFKPFTTDTLYKGYKADLWSFDTQAQVLFLRGEGLQGILVNSIYESDMEASYVNFDKVNGEYVEDYVHELVPCYNEPSKIFLRVKPAFNIGVLSLKYRDFAFEGYVQVGLNSFIAADGANDLFGYDGMYGYGISAAYKELVSVKAGFHHYSGHYSDEILESMMERKDILGRSYRDRIAYSEGEPGYIKKATEYVRQDSLILGLSVQPLSFLRVYGEADLLVKNMDTLRPWIFIPEGINCSWADKDMRGRIGVQEISAEDAADGRLYKYSDKYKAMIFNLGAELKFDFKQYGAIELAYNCRLNQEGQTMSQFNCYKEDNPWGVDHTAFVSYRAPSAPVTIDVSYHSGRIPLLNFYYHNDSYIGVGLSVEW